MNIKISNEQIEQMISKAVMEEAEKKAYDKGLNDAWELVKRVV